MSDVANATADALAEVGKQVTLRRPGGPSVVCYARSDLYTAQEIGGGVIQGDRKVILSNREILAADFPGPPRRGDQIIMGGLTTTIQGVDTQSVGDVVVRHNCQVRGG